MHLYFISRGNKMWSDEFIKQLQGVYLPMKLKLDEKGQMSDNGKEQLVNVQLGVRPVQLYEIAFPKEHKDLILATVLGEQPMRKEYSRFGKYLALLRKALGLSPIEKYDSSKRLPVLKENLDIIGLGLKDDKQYGWGEGI